MTKDANTRINNEGVAVGQREWLYPDEHKPPTGVKLHLLTKGEVAVHGVWRNDGTYIAWEPMPHKRKEVK